MYKKLIIFGYIMKLFVILLLVSAVIVAKIFYSDTVDNRRLQERSIQIRDYVNKHRLLPSGLVREINICLENLSEVGVVMTGVMLLGLVIIINIVIIAIAPSAFILSTIIAISFILSVIITLSITSNEKSKDDLRMMKANIVKDDSGSFLGYSADNLRPCYSPKNIVDRIYIGDELVYSGEIYGILPHGKGFIYINGVAYSGIFSNGFLVA